jgi:hypothetical protein
MVRIGGEGGVERRVMEGAEEKNVRSWLKLGDN